MSETLETIRERLVELIRTSGSQARFAEAVVAWNEVEESALAELIETDGRLRMQLGYPVELKYYLEAAPRLAEQPVALDAAIDVALASASERTGDIHSAGEALAASHPSLRGAIENAVALTAVVYSAVGVRSSKHAGGGLPRDFGPDMGDGRARYELQRLIGMGAFGAVYRAIDRRLSDADKPAEVAIKILASRSRSSRTQWRFAEEAAKIRRVDHPNVTRVFDCGESDSGEDYIVYEFVGGGTLDDWRRGARQSLDPRTAAHLMAQIARGVQAAHSAGLIHCDLKPANILLTVDHQPKVADFGLAIRMDDQGSAAGLMEYYKRPGNLAFMAPERFRAEGRGFDAPADIYSLGGMLFWLLTGSFPNGSTKDEIEARFAAENELTPIAPREIRPELDRDLDLICQRAMAASPEQRFTSAGALAEDLESWLRLEPIAWTRPSPARRARLMVRRRPAMAGLAALLATAIAIGGAISWRYSEIARAREMAAAVAELELKIQKESSERVQAGLLLQSSRQRNSTREHEPRLATSVFMEWYSQRDHVDAAALTRMIQIDRSSHLREFARERREALGDDAFETLLWDTFHGVTLAQIGAHTEGEPLFRDLKARWGRFLGPDEPWMVRLDALHACLEIDAEMSTGQTVDTGRIRDAVTRIHTYLADFRLENDGRVYNRICQERLNALVESGQSLGFESDEGDFARLGAGTGSADVR
ncbi:MAG: serine/threonine-protein kinase [Planctomycetota bacterium]|nr:serine/threonine-protein kinase [Planctomycetota bacterium]